MKPAVVAGALFLGLAAVVVRAATAGGAPNGINFKLNAASFGSEFGGASPERAVQTAGTTWTWSAGMRRHYDYTGLTTAYGCSPGNPNHIYAVPGTDPYNPSTMAFFFYCPIGGWVIQTYLGSAKFTLGIPAVDEQDFQGLITHELGHDTTPFHASTSDCVLSAVSTEGDRNRFFCTEDIETWAGNGHGHARAQAFHATSSAASWPQAGSTGWAIPPAGSWFFYGFGMGTLSRGSSGSSFETVYAINTASPLHGMLRCPIGSNCVDVAGLTQLESLHRPTAAFDYRRGRWWLFWLIKAGNQVQYATSNDGVNFSYFGSVGNPAITSRVPVGAAYDNMSDRMLVAYTNYAGISFSDSNAAGKTYNVALSSIAASTPGGTWTAPAILANRETDMPPAIACENSVVTYRCQLLRQSPSGDRAILSWRVGLDSSGNLVGNDTDENTGGLTNYPIGLTFNGPTSSGSFVAAVSGAAATNYMWKLEKKNVWNPWSGWQVISGLPSTYLGPQISVKEGNNNYELVYALFP